MRRPFRKTNEYALDTSGKRSKAARTANGLTTTQWLPDLAFPDLAVNLDR
jgi:hypothetical protein